MSLNYPKTYNFVWIIYIRQTYMMPHKCLQPKYCQQVGIVHLHYIIVYDILVSKFGPIMPIKTLYVIKQKTSCINPKIGALT